MDKRSTEYRKGMGNWEALGDDVEPVFRAAEKRTDALKAVARPWSVNFQSHRNCAVNAGDRHLPNYYWDHGSGIYYWKPRHGGKVLALKEKDFSAAHFSQIKFEGYKRVSPNNEFAICLVI